MRTPLAALRALPLLLAVAAFPARAGQAGADADFAPLRDELERRRDEDFGGTLDATLKRQKAAVLKSLAALDGSGDDLRDELGALRTCAKALRPAYPGEFSTSGAPPVLGTLVGELLTLFGDRVEAIVDDLAERVDRLPADEAPRVEPLLAKAQSLLAGLDPSDPAGAAGDLLRALGAAEKGLRKADALDARRGSLAFTIGAFHYASDSVDLRYAAFNWFDLEASTEASPQQAPPPPGAFRLLIQVRGADGTGIYYAEVVLGPGGDGIYRATSGDVGITSQSGKDVQGAFSFVGRNPSGATRTVNGTFSARR